MAEITEANGGVQVAYMMTAHNYIFAKPEVTSLDALQGLKVRSHSTVLSDLLSGMGADPQFIAFADVYTALERGVIDGAISCGSCGYGLRWYEVADYLVGPIVSVGHSWFTISHARWDDMPKLDFTHFRCYERGRLRVGDRGTRELLNVWGNYG